MRKRDRGGLWSLMIRICGVDPLPPFRRRFLFLCSPRVFPPISPPVSPPVSPPAPLPAYVHCRYIVKSGGPDVGVLDATNQLKPSGKTADAVHELFEKVCV